MKKILFTFILAGTWCAAQSQTGTVKPIAKAVPQPVLKTQMDSVSYILGVFIAKNLKSQNFELNKINKNLFNLGLSDVAKGTTPKIDDAAGNTVINNYVMGAKERQAQQTIIESKAFLDANAKRPGVKTTASGLQYEILSLGTGEKMNPVDTFICHYNGTLINGTQFDASYNRGQPLKMAIIDVIKGWQEGLLLMPVGSKFKLFIPATLGYGMMGQGSIPPGAALIFDMELIGLVRKQN